jgi:cobalt-zinc-cadmium resistance protein CzcA
MLTRILAFSLRQPLLILALTALLVGVGLWSAAHLSIDAVPDVTNVQVQINTNAPALSPVEVERQITFPVEVAMAGLPGVDEVRSLSKFGLSQVTVVFKDDVNIYFARQLVQERLQLARDEIPPGLGMPGMGPISTGLGEIFQYTVESPTKDLTELRTLQDWIVKRQLRTVPGVAEVNSFGGFEKQYHVLIRPEALIKHDLTLRHVFETIAANNINVGGGYIVKAAEQFLIRGVGQVQNLDQIRNIVLASHDGVPVRVGDVAEVEVGSSIRQGAVTQDGKGEVVTGIVMMLLGANSRVVVDDVKSRFESVGRTLPSDVKLKPFYDRTELVKRTIHTVESNLLEGALLVVAVLFLLLGNLRAALVVALAIPLSMLFAVSCMVQAGVAGSLMSLGAIDFGLIVDGSVVMVENSMRHLSERKRDQSFLRSVLDSCAEVGRPIVAGVGIIIVVYLPILTLQGVEGKLFKPMAATVAFALVGSLLLTFLLTPVLISFFLRGRISEKENFLIHWVKQGYAPVLDACLAHRKPVILIALVAVSAASVCMPFLGSEFIPRLDEGAIAMQILRLPSVSLEEAIEQSTLVEKILLKSFPDEIETVVSKTGRAEIATDPMGVNISDTFVMLKPREQWKVAKDKAILESKIADTLSRIPGLAFGFSQPIELRVNELIAGVRSDIAIKIYGDELDVLRGKADEVVAAVGKLQGASGFKAQQVMGLPALEIAVEPDQIARYGINARDVMEVVEALGGIETTVILEGQRRFDLVVKFPANVRKDKHAIANLLVSAPGGERVPLGSLARIEEIEGPAEISHENGSRLIVIEGNVRGRDIGSFVDDARTLFEDGRIELPPGYRPEFGGQFENLERARTRLLIVVPLSLFLIFLLLFTTFHSVRQAALVFTGVPLAAVGGVFALGLRGMPFSISAGVGFIALFGVAVLNGLVMVTHINKLVQEGRSLSAAVREGALTRLRPVLMTALVASLGFIPMAISTGAGAEVQRPLATVVIGGLISSTLLTLLVLPLLYCLFEQRQRLLETKEPALDASSKSIPLQPQTS